MPETTPPESAEEFVTANQYQLAFWVYVPTEPPEQLRPDAGDEPMERVVRRVVTIRDDSAELPDLYH